MGLDDHERVAVICLMEGQTKITPNRGNVISLSLSVQYLY
jgi:hypothetical protein